MIPFYKPEITQQDIDAVVSVMKSGYISEGQEVEKFEKEFAKFVGAKYAVVTDSETSALMLLLDFLEVSQVNMPTATYVSMPAAVVKMGMKLTLNDNWHVGGVIPIFTDKGIIYDSAHLVERDICNRDKNGYWLFSLHATKIVTAGHGGVIAINSKHEYEHLKRLKDSCRIRRADKFEYTVPMVGWNMEFTDIQAALGRSQLGRLDQTIQRRGKLLDVFRGKIESNPNDIFSQYLVQVFVKNRIGFTRFADKNNIEISRHFIPVHTQPAFHANDRLPNSEYLSEHLVSIPYFLSITDKEIDQVCTMVNQWRKVESQQKN